MEYLGLIILFIVGVVFIGSGIYFLWKRAQILKLGTQVTASIIDYHVDVHDDGSPIYFPVIEFLDPHGKLVTHRMTSGSDRKHKRQRLNLKYLLEDGTYNFEEVHERGATLYIGISIVGLVFVVLGILAMIREQII